MLVILVPILLGFILPLIQMLYWASLTFHEVWSTSLLSIVWSSFYLSMITAFICICISFLLIYAAKWSRSLIIQRLSSLPILGYAVPGVVIAVGIMIPTLIFDKWLVNIAQYYLNWSMGFLINGTIIGLIFAYSVRFLAVAYHPIEASIQKTGMRFEQAAQMLGVQRWKRMLQINIPLNKLGLLSGALLVFVDTMKELPLTLLLKPYGIMTLSVKAFEYASDERIAETALPALFIIMTGLIPIFLLNRMMNA
jgi:iron(III) transport system permease protein